MTTTTIGASPTTPGAAPVPPRAALGATTPARVILTLVRGYQLARMGHASPCRFTPTCSQYAAEAVARHGARKGLHLAGRRLWHCRPRGPFGADPVPE